MKYILIVVDDTSIYSFQGFTKTGEPCFGMATWSAPRYTANEATEIEARLLIEDSTRRFARLEIDSF